MNKFNFSTVLNSRDNDLEEPKFSKVFNPKIRGGYEVLSMKPLTLGSVAISALTMPPDDIVQTIDGKKMFERNILADKIHASLKEEADEVELCNTDTALITKVIGEKYKNNGAVVGSAWSLLE